LEATITRKKTVTPTTIAGHTVPIAGTGTLAMMSSAIQATMAPHA
jgi:hypothetical protein